MFAFINDILIKYNGGSEWLLLYAAAVSCIFLTGKRLGWGSVVLGIPLCMTGIILAPPFQVLFNHFLDSQTYYRFLWTLPLALTIACCGASIVGKIKISKVIDNVRFAILTIVLSVVIILCGSPYYKGQYVEPSANPYHLPESVVKICDFILPENGDRVAAAFPAEMLLFVRQYSTKIIMPYGREVMVDGWHAETPFYDLMISDNIDAGELSDISKSFCCNYLILDKNKRFVGDIGDYGYIVAGEIDGYNIYKDTTVTWPN